MFDDMFRWVEDKNGSQNIGEGKQSAMWLKAGDHK